MGLEPCLQSLAIYCTNEKMYFERKLEETSFANQSRGHRDDIKLINIYDKKLIEIMSINSSYYIEFSRIRQLIHKLSSGTLKEQLMSKLQDIK